MEAVATSLATSTLNFAVKIAVSGITRDFRLLEGVQDELLFIKHEFEMMQVFLRDASVGPVENSFRTIWIQQVKDLAMDLDDCLQEASVHLMENSCLAMCSVNKQDRIARKIRALKARTIDVINRIQRYNQVNGGHTYEKINNQINKTNGGSTYEEIHNQINKTNGGSTYEEIASTRFIANVEVFLVGLDEPKRKLVKLIQKEDREVISVVGMGGLGKTTLVREVFGCQELRNEFNHFAWVTIQHPFNKEEFIESLAKQIPSNNQEVDDEGGTMEGNKIKSEVISKKTIKGSSEKKVKEYLKDKKHLIVLDDLSSVSEWDMIKNVLSPNNGSRTIVTTRFRRPLAEHISHPSDIYQIKELSKDDALDLFLKAVYKTPNYPFVSEEGPSSNEIAEGDSNAHKQCITNTITEEEDREIKEELPHENKCNMKNGSISTEATKENSEVREQCMTKDMKTQAGLIVESCGRLPLAIVTIGSYLATKKKTGAEWKEMHDHLSSELANNRDLGAVDTILTSSYDGMPYHLKPSLLYLSVFHNHMEIRRSRIIRRWMADGYVMEGRIKEVDELKKGYFYDLMGRSLIQPSQMSTIVNVDVKRCNIHDIMYQLILRKAVDESMVSVLEDGKIISMTDKVRHLVIRGGSCTGGKVLESVELSHMQSLTIFGEVGDYLKYSRMKLVRVLDLEGTINLNDGDLRSIGKLRHLKYLGLRGTKITKLPNSLGKLSELETLDIRNTNVLLLPTGLTKLHKLSYLRAGKNGYSDKKRPIDSIDNGEEKIGDKCSPTIQGMAQNIVGIMKYVCLIPLLPLIILEWFLNSNISQYSSGVRVPQGIGKLRSLSTFGVIDIGGSKSLAKEMQNLTNLHKLAVTNFTEENGKTLAKVIDGLKHLRSLVLNDADDLGLKCCLESVSSPPKYLQSLKLNGRIGKLPDWISSLENLEKIYFKHTYLTEDIKAIEKLPNLKILYLLRFSFEEDVKELCFGEGTFPMLQVMIIEGPNWLESVSIKKTALKRLEQLKISYCWDIGKGGVSGLDFLVQLKEMMVTCRFESEKTFVNNLEEKLSMHPNKPILRVTK